MCIGSKIPETIRITKEALKNGEVLLYSIVVVVVVVIVVVIVVIVVVIVVVLVVCCNRPTINWGGKNT